MQKIGFFNALIQELEKIYARLVLTVLHSRMDRYQQQARQRLHPHAADIKSPLLACINTLAADARAAADATTSVIPDNPATSLPPDAANGIEIQAINKENIGELSKYFKARANGAELHPAIEIKLEQSTWEHLLAALRYAKQGNTQTARMHANIASSACQELAHYMRENDYNEFIGEINKHLQALTQHQRVAVH